MFHRFLSTPQASYLSAFTTFLWTCAPFLVAVSSFTAFILLDPANNVLDAQTAFVSLTYFNLLRMPLNMLPQLIVLMVQTTVSLRRVNKFMNAEELDPLNVTRDEGLMEFPVFTEQASFTWGSGQPNEVFLTSFKLFLS
jgi:ABC-type multidrug transport system fused ATPase/permease subunit